MTNPSLPPVSGDEAATVSGKPDDQGLTLPPELGTEAIDGPAEIDGHRVVGLLGRGGMGVVYKVWRKGRPGDVFALKLLKEVPAEYATLSESRHDNELLALARLDDHPNFVHVQTVGRYEGRPYFLLEYVEGGTLQGRLNGRPWSADEAVPLMATLARAMHFAHQRGIIHRDLKPANVLLQEPLVPKISDFGLARQVEQSGLTQTGAVVGTAEYMAPEQAAGQIRKIDHRTDIYALGVILFELLTGQPPFRGKSRLDTIKLIASKPGLQVPPALATQPELCAICLQCLRAEPGDRYPSALALAVDLERTLTPQPRPTLQARITPAWRLRNWIKLNPWVRPATAVAAIVLLLSISAVLSFVLTRERYIRDLEQETRRANTERERAERRLLAQRMQKVLEVRPGEPARALGLLRDETACPSRLRDFSWRWLEEACLDARWQHDLGADFHAELGFNAAGDRLAGRDRDGEVRLWRIDRRQRQPVLLGSHGRAGCLALRPDGQALALGRANGTVEVEESGSRKVLLSLRQPARVVCFSRDGQYLATAEEKGLVCVWHSDRLVHQLEGPRAIRTLTFLDDGRALVAGAGQEAQRRGELVWWDLDGPTRHTLEPRWKANGLVAVAHPSRPVLAFSTAEGEVIGLDLVTRQEQFRFQGSARGIGAVAFASDGRRLAVGDQDAPGPDGLLAGSLSVVPLDPPGPPRSVQAMQRSVLAVAFAGDALLAADDRSLACLSLAPTLASHSPGDHTDRVQSVAVSPDGTLLLTGGDDRTARLWRLGSRSATLLRTLTAHGDLVRRVAIAPDGRTFATADLAGQVCVWPAEGGKPSQTLAHPGAVVGLAYAGNRLLTACGDTLRLWDVATGRELSHSPGCVGIFCLAVSQDGSRAATGGSEGDSAIGLIELWRIDAERGRLEREQPLRGHPSEVTCLAFDAAGTTLASGEMKPGAVRLWDVVEHDTRATLSLNRGATALAFAPDGQTLLSASAWDAETPALLTFWDRVTAEERLGFSAHGAAVTALAFDPNGRLFVTASNDHTIALWAASAPGAGGSR